MSSLNAKNRLVKPFIANSKIIFTLPLGGKIRRGSVILSGSVTISGGTTNGTVNGEGGPTNLVSRILVTATPAGGSRYPGGKIVDIDPRSLIRYATTQRNGKVFTDMNGATLGNGAAGTYPVYLPIPIYFADAVQRNSLATALNTDPGTYASVQVEVDTQDLPGCFTGTDRTASGYPNLTVQWVDERVAVDGDTAVLYQESHPLLIAATNKRLLDEAMPQDGAFMSWQILAQQSAQNTLADTLLNRVVTSGPTLEYDKYANDIREADFADEWYDQSITAAGMFFIDWTDGVVTANNVPAGTLQTYLDVNNVSGANLDSLLISTRRIFQPTPASSK